MERKEYLTLCQRCTVGGGELVEYDGIKYYPKAYELHFDKKGNPSHIAILKDANANSVTYCALERVQKVDL